MRISSIGYIICESGITDVHMKPRIIREDAIEVPDENGEPIKHRRVIAESILQTGNLKNRNGRIYRTPDLAGQLETERTKTLISHGMFCGEAGHPLDATIVRQQTIDPKLISVRYTKLWMDGDYVWGQYKGTNTQYGEALDMDLREGCIPEFSLRALGSIDKSREGDIVVNLKMITYDQVFWQSDPNAYTRKVMNEAATMGNTSSKQEDILEPISNEQVNAYILAESANIKAIKESFDVNYDSIKYLPEMGKVRLNSKDGDIMMVNVESYIANELQNYVRTH